jgi:hypothetical protein
MTRPGFTATSPKPRALPIRFRSAATSPTRPRRTLTGRSRRARWRGPAIYLLDVVRPKRSRAVPRALRLLGKLAGARAVAYVASALSRAASSSSKTVAFTSRDSARRRRATSSRGRCRRRPLGIRGKSSCPRIGPGSNRSSTRSASFTGIKDRHDDQVDALAAAVDGLHGAGPIDSAWSEDFESLTRMDPDTRGYG